MSIPLPQIAHLEIRLLENGRLRIVFPYHPDNVKRIKAIPGRRWHGEDKVWSIPYTEQALSLLDQYFINNRSRPSQNLKNALAR